MTEASSRIPQLTAVIPTTGRRELSTAVASAAAQLGEVAVEIVIVADLAETSPEAAAVRGIAAGHRLIFTGGSRGAAHARNLGTRAATGDWIAYLDDDDEWDPLKSSIQMRAAASSAATVISCRVRQLVANTSEVIAASVPTRLMGEHQRPAEYLFWRRRPNVGRASLFTSTFVVRRDLAMKVAWNESLRRHQDWDWIVRAASESDYRFVHVPEVAATINVGSLGSISAGSNWSDSLAWGQAALVDERPEVLVDFAFGQPLRYALQARSWDGIRRVMAVARAQKRVPSFGPTVIGMSGVLGRRGLEATMKAIK